MNEFEMKSCKLYSVLFAHQTLKAKDNEFVLLADN